MEQEEMADYGVVEVEVDNVTEVHLTMAEMEDIMVAVEELEALELNIQDGVQIQQKEEMEDIMVGEVEDVEEKKA